jgi:hypothetical protein
MLIDKFKELRNRLSQIDLSKKDLSIMSVFNASFSGDIVKTRALGEASEIATKFTAKLSEIVSPDITLPEVSLNATLTRDIRTCFTETGSRLMRHSILNYGYDNGSIVGFGVSLSIYVALTIGLCYLSKKRKIPSYISSMPLIYGACQYGIALLGDIIKF